MTNTPTSVSIFPATALHVLEASDWRARIHRHHEKLLPIVQPHLERASHATPHPVIDFLFHYYPFAPAHLLRWSPGWGVVCRGEATADLLAIKDGQVTPEGWRLDPAKFPFRRRDAIRWVKTLLQQTAERPPRFGCFGLHEWAMVYRSEQVRHQQLPLRLSREATAHVVESMPIVCSHYDAFRFFTPEARPLNKLQPDREKRLDLEQRGCLHVNMDLYKWATQFYPWISSDLIADCFRLAVEIREVDMRASPYDVATMGYTPICIETEEGRRDYVQYQQQFAESAVPLRERLIAEFDVLSRVEA